MNKKYKRVFSINLQPGYRNYTVKDLQDVKGKKKLTQILVNDASEASAAEEAGIDLILACSIGVGYDETQCIKVNCLLMSFL